MGKMATIVRSFLKNSRNGPKIFLRRKNEALPVPISQVSFKERDNPWEDILVIHFPYINLLTHSTTDLVY